jgi:hypothetical protein
MLGDGASASGFGVSHAYAVAGTYTATLGVRDKDGGLGQDTGRVVVTKRPTRLAYTGPLSLTFGFPAALSARLTDAADPATARLGGRLVRFAMGGATLTALTGPDGVATTTLPAGLAGTLALTVSFAEDADYLASSATATLRVVNSSGCVTAGMLRTADGGHGAFDVHSDGTHVWGDLQFQAGRSSFQAREITALGISSDRRKAWFAGVGTDGRPFLAYAEDNGETGRHDVFKLKVGGVSWTGDGRLTDGNVQFHDRCDKHARCVRLRSGKH